MNIRSRAGDLRRWMWSSWFCRWANLGDLGPVISLTFDDFPRSAASVAAPLLQKYGVRATYYVSMSLMNCENNLGEQFRRDDLYSLLEAKHEIANHTYSHVSAHQVSFAEFHKEVTKGELAVQDATGSRASGNFAYPYGAVTLATKRKLGQKMKSVRGTCVGINGPDVDLNLLRANPLYGGIESIAAARQLISENEAKRGWLIFYSHDVASKPSRFGCTPELLEEVCTFAAKRESRFLPVAAVVQHIEKIKILRESIP